jgi:ribosomal protein L30/L7E
LKSPREQIRGESLRPVRKRRQDVVERLRLWKMRNCAELKEGAGL